MLSADFLSVNATVIVELAVFLTVLAIVGRVAVKPIRAAMEQRRAHIKAALDEASQAAGIVAAAEADYQATVDNARQEARRLIEMGRELGDFFREEGRREGRAERDRLIAQAGERRSADVPDSYPPAPEPGAEGCVSAVR